MGGRKGLHTRNQERVRNFVVEGAAPQVARGGRKPGSIVGRVIQQPVLLASIRCHQAEGLNLIAFNSYIPVR